MSLLSLYLLTRISVGLRECVENAVKPVNAILSILELYPLCCRPKRIKNCILSMREI